LLIIEFDTVEVTEVTLVEDVFAIMVEYVAIVVASVAEAVAAVKVVCESVEAMARIFKQLT